MTGAPMPRGADTVYPQEFVERRGRSPARAADRPKGANVRYRGEDVQAGRRDRAPAPCCGRRSSGSSPRSASAGARAPPPARGAPVHRRRGRRAGHAAQARPDLRRQPLHAARPRSSSAAARSSTSASSPTARRAARAPRSRPPTSADVVVTLGRRLGRRLRPREGGARRDRRDRFLAGGDAAGTAARRRPHRSAPLLRPARQPGRVDARLPCSSCGPRSASCAGRRAAPSPTLPRRWRSSPCARRRAAASSSAASCSAERPAGRSRTTGPAGFGYPVLDGRRQLPHRARGGARRRGGRRDRPGRAVLDR